MFNLLYAGFDTLDVAFAGALPINTLAALEQAREKAQERQEPVLLTIGPGKITMHVSGYGMRGGYAFVTDTGPVGIKWLIKKNADARQWNIFASPRATMLLALGYKGTRDQLLDELEKMGARITDHSINRVDFAMDFQTQGFELHQDQFVAHSHTKVSSHWENLDSKMDRNQPAAVLRGRRLESVTIGKQPGRQVIIYDKRREAIERQKYFWFKAWGVDCNDPSLEVWRIEVRAGKNELKNKYQIRNFSDFEASVGDVIVNALQEVRYLADRQHDSNVTRQHLHPLWSSAQSVAGTDLMDLRSGLTPDQIVEITRDLAIQRYTNLCIGNAIGLGVSLNLDNDEFLRDLPELIAGSVATAIQTDDGHLEKLIQRARARLHFLRDSLTS